MKFALHRRPARVPRRACATCSRRSARPRTCATRGPTTPGACPGLWDKLAEMGVVGLLAPEAAGGLGLTDVDLVLVLEETGRHAVPEPIVETAAFGVPLLGDPDARRRDRATSSCRGPTPPTSSSPPRAGSTAATDASSPRDRRSTAPAASSRCSGEQHADRRQAVAAAFDRAVLGTAAQQCGLADRMLEMTVEYAKQRRAVRRADRFVPGREAPPRQRPRWRSSSRARSCTAPRRRSLAIRSHVQSWPSRRPTPPPC